ncbi:MAG: hypothetical protein V1816_12790 [Pseudomonadota bacterium]
MEEGVQDEWPYPLHYNHYKAIQAGVQEASRIRVDEITREDYPWVQQVMAPLSGRITVPCEPYEFTALWDGNKTIENLMGQEGTVKLPPQHLEEGPLGILRDLEGLGLIQRLRDGRIQMPDVYRVAFGLGRRGGVNPFK